MSSVTTCSSPCQLDNECKLAIIFKRPVTDSDKGSNTGRFGIFVNDLLLLKTEDGSPLSKFVSDLRGMVFMTSAGTVLRTDCSRDFFTNVCDSGIPFDQTTLNLYYNLRSAYHNLLLENFPVTWLPSTAKLKYGNGLEFAYFSEYFISSDRRLYLSLRQILSSWEEESICKVLECDASVPSRVASSLTVKIKAILEEIDSDPYTDPRLKKSLLARSRYQLIPESLCREESVASYLTSNIGVYPYAILLRLGFSKLPAMDCVILDKDLIG